MRTLLRTLALVLALTLAGGYVWNSSKKATPADELQLSSLDHSPSITAPQKVIVPSVLAATTKSGRIYFKEGWVDLTKTTTPAEGNIEAYLIPYEDTSVDRTNMRSAFEQSSLVDIYFNTQPSSTSKTVNINQSTSQSTLDTIYKPNDLIMSSKIGIVAPPILPSNLSSSTKSGTITPIKIRESKTDNPVTNAIDSKNIMPGTKSIGALIRSEQRAIKPSELLPGSKSRGFNNRSTRGEKSIIQPSDIRPGTKYFAPAINGTLLPNKQAEPKKKITPSQIMPGTKSAPQSWKTKEKAAPTLQIGLKF